jgi:hypothetical protein
MISEKSGGEQVNRYRYRMDRLLVRSDGIAGRGGEGSASERSPLLSGVISDNRPCSRAVTLVARAR